MTTKAAFTPEEWELVRSGPTVAGMLVIAASHGGMVRETFEMAKVYADARLTLTERVAKRHKEDGVEVSPAEQQAIDDVRGALG